MREVANTNDGIEILRALQKQLDEDGVELHSFSAGTAGPTNDEPGLIDSEW